MTAQEFITAVQAGGTVEVDSDIDFNDYYFSNYIDIPTGITINGNGYTITNIQDGTSSYIFYIRGVFIMNRLNIRNLNLLTGTLFRTVNSTQHNLNECQISGNCYKICDVQSGGTAVTCNRCSIHINRFWDIKITLNDCYVILENNLVTSGQSYVYTLGTSANNTYFKGKINLTDALTVATTFSNCCINIDVIDNDNLLTLNNSGDVISIINSTKATHTSLNSNIVAVTDTEMHDAQSLFDKGFNIYVPST